MSRPAFPTLAAVARVASATRGASRIVRASAALLAGFADARITRRPSRGERAAAMSATCAAVCAVHGVELELVGAVPTRACVLVANRVSYLDPLAILARMPAAPLAKAEVADWPGIFGLAMLAGVPVVPIALRFEDPGCAWTGDADFLPHYWWLSTRPRARLRMTVRAPMWPHTAEHPEDFAARVRTAIALSLDRVTIVRAPDRPAAIHTRPRPLPHQEIA